MRKQALKHGVRDCEWRVLNCYSVHFGRIRLRKQALKHGVRDCEWCVLSCYSLLQDNFKKRVYILMKYAIIINKGLKNLMNIERRLHRTIIDVQLVG